MKLTYKITDILLAYTRADNYQQQRYNKLLSEKTKYLQKPSLFGVIPGMTKEEAEKYAKEDLWIHTPDEEYPKIIEMLKRRMSRKPHEIIEVSTNEAIFIDIWLSKGE